MTLLPIFLAVRASQPSPSSPAVQAGASASPPNSSRHIRSARSRKTALKDSVDVPTDSARRVLYTPAMPRMGPRTRVEKLHTRRKTSSGLRNSHQSNCVPLRYFEPTPMRLMAVQAAARETATPVTAPIFAPRTPCSTPRRMDSIVAVRGRRYVVAADMGGSDMVLDGEDDNEGEDDEDQEAGEEALRVP